MAKLDLDALQRRVASMTDIANPSAVAKTEPGAVFEIPDELVRFPGDPPRTWHEARRVIVVQSHGLLGPVQPDTVSVVPCSASQNGARRGDFLIPPGEKAFTKPNVVAYATLLMPVLKKALTGEGYRGRLSDEAYGQLLATISANLGLGSALGLSGAGSR
jgi:hypothetical protein